MSGAKAAALPAVEQITAEEQAQLDAMQSADDAPWEEGDAAAPPPPPPEEPPGELAPEPEPEGTPQKKVVPLEALHAERERVKRLQEQVAEGERTRAAEMARLQERLDLLAQAAQNLPAAAPPAAVALPVETPAPDPATDPMGYVKWSFERQQAAITAQNERLQRMEQAAQQGSAQTAQQQQIQQLTSWGFDQETEYAKTRPDYGAAVNYLRQAREAMHRAMGATPAETRQAIANETLSLAQRAFQTNRSFPQMAYDVAVAAGYKPAAAPDPTPAPAPDPAAAMARATRGAAMAPGLPSGSAPRGEPSAQALANMSDTQFAAYLAKVEKDPAAMKALFGE